METLNFRFATPDDQRGVAAISGEVYSGLDYLIESFQAIIQNPRFYGLVGEIHGDTVRGFIIGMSSNGRTPVVLVGRKFNAIYHWSVYINLMK